MPAKSKKSEIFINDFIPRVSRTFALAIKFLPENLRHSVFSAYLLCRVADTIEDSPRLCVDEKKRRLDHLKRILLAAVSESNLAPEDIAPIYEGVVYDGDHDHRLLGESLQLFDALGELPLAHQRIIYKWVSEMAGGMGEFAGLTGNNDGKIAALKNIAEWDRYCYYVAGTVGRMLTDLLLEEYKFDTGAAANMQRLCNSFGLGLQKVNTIKDVPHDRGRGAVFLPLEIIEKHGLSPIDLNDISKDENIKRLVAELLELAVIHLDDAVEYISSVPEKLNDVRMFLIVPVLLAIETLNLISDKPVQTMTGPAVKLTRRNVTILTSKAVICSRSNPSLRKYYGKLRDKRRRGSPA